jgi:hypothetical protein
VTIEFKSTDYQGLLVIGDPHLESRVPGFRKDNYPEVVLTKLQWCLDYAASERLLPAILGDLFHLPRDNPNWMLVKLIEMFDREVVAIYGNHDVHENAISDDDSLSVLVQAGRVKILDERAPFCGMIGSRPVVVGGTPWGQFLPKGFEMPADYAGARPLVFWLTHHDIVLPGYEELGRFKPGDLPGIDVVVNGHVHRRLESVAVGGTQWFTPGNISRRSRSDATRQHLPSVMRIDIGPAGWKHEYVEVPHRSFDDVFHEAILEDVAIASPSAFVTGLAELQTYRTQTGEGLMAFLDQNLDQFEEDVAQEVRQLAQEVLQNG